jgi:DNA-binding response OmpR family regulator
MRVLVVEDDRSLGSFLKKGMEQEGHQAGWVQDGDAALIYTADHHPDLILLDLCLPKRDGTEVLAELQARREDASVLVLTARIELNVRVQCLDLGADDCLLKPFSYFELTARCRALLRRRQHFADPVLRHGDLELHRIEHKVSRAGQPIGLTAKEFSLLEFLLLHRGECVSRGQLLAEVWQMQSETGTNIVDVYVNYVRRKIDPESSGLIETVRGMGYRLGGLGRKPVARQQGHPRASSAAAYA